MPVSSAAPVEPSGATARPPRAGLSWGLVGFVAGIAVFFAVSLLVNHFAGGSTGNGPIVVLALLPNVFLGLGPAVLSWWRGHGPRLDFGIRFTRADLSTGFACGVAALFVGIVVNYLMQTFVYHEQSQRNVGEELNQLSGGRSVWLLIALLFTVFVAPLTEEMLMRGALWGGLEYWRVPRLIVLALTAVVFAFLHDEPTLTLGLFCQGVALGTARMRTGRIGASMIAHATNNVLPALVLWFISKP